MTVALRRVYRQAIPAGFALSVLALSINAAFADTTDLGTVTTSAEATSSAAAPASPAAEAAPSKATLEATEPQSIVSRVFMDNAKPANADYASIAAIAPSVAGGLTSNGPGLGETKNTIRGFQDGQFNITWDGIPFGDTNGPTHHSIAYFPGMNIGSIDVERGPGLASNLGQATYGGSMNLYSRPVSNTEGLDAFFSTGSWATNLLGFRYDTGNVPDLNSKATFSYQDLTSNGALTNSPVIDQTLAFKSQTALGDSTVVTVDLNHTIDDLNTPDAGNGLTWQQALQYGKNYSLSTDATKGNYYGYNTVDKRTDMDYVRVQSDLSGGWSIDNTSYYYNYYNQTHAAGTVTPGAGEVTSTKSCDSNPGATVAIANCIPGYVKINKYWVAGNIFKANDETQYGLLTTGLWLEHSETFRSRDYINSMNNQTVFAQNGTPNTAPNYIKYDQEGAWNNYQPFVEFAWKATDKLTVTPGFKYVNTLLNVNADVNQTARIEQNVDKLFTAKLPYLTANYRFNPEWSAYAQFAKGMVVPDISYFQSAQADFTNISPATTTNYQLGVVHQEERLAFDADVYDIKVNNQFLVAPGTSSQPVYYNAGEVSYKGIEGEISYLLTHGFTAFVNGSVNHTHNSTLGGDVPNAPMSTSAAGLLYAANNWNASYVYKHVGDSYVFSNDEYKQNGYNTSDVTVGYTFNPHAKVHKVKVQLGIYNIQNRQSVLTINPFNSADTGSNPGDMLLFQAPRSYMGSVNVSL